MKISLSAWAVISLGAWMMVAPWVLGFYEINLALWSNTVSGGLVILITLWRAAPPGEE